jgi:hypothetical protein
MSQLIRLKYAETEDVNIDGMYGTQQTNIRAKVKNVAFAKDVEVYYDQGNGTWQSLVLPWIANFGDYDVFGRDGGFFTHRVALRCTEAGITDWDNNGYANYPAPDNGVAAGGSVVLNQATARRAGANSWLEGTIYVNNLSYAKNVGLRYTANGWTSFQDVAATYLGPVFDGDTEPGDAEAWSFKTPALPYDNPSDTFEFVVYYNRVDNGEWFWDDNFAQNYKLSKVDGSTIE